MAGEGYVCWGSPEKNRKVKNNVELSGHKVQWWERGRRKVERKRKVKKEKGGRRRGGRKVWWR